jgi:mono/diheme cytochrome c family protein
VADYLLSFNTPTTTLPGATTTTTLPRSGAAVYAASCALCHGPEAANLRGHDLSLSQIISITSNGTGTMRGYSGTLSTAEIDNVSRYVSSFGAVSGVTTTTAPAGSPVSGATLYMQNCSGCHGLHGEGGPGGAIAGTGLSRSGIISLIDAGTNGMPGYGSQLSAGEIAAITDHVQSMSSGGGPQDASVTGDTVTAAGEPFIAPELAVGHALYGQFCASCHGRDGEGGLGGPIVGSELDATGLSMIIRGGLSTMPAFAGQMTDSELEALVGFTEVLASGAGLTDPDATTADDRLGETFAAGLSSPTALTRDSNNDGDLSAAVVIAVVFGVVMAGGAVFLWMRAARNLVG